MKQKDKQIRKLLEEKRQDVMNISATLNKSKVEKLKKLAREVHYISFSALLEICIGLGLDNPEINPIAKRKEE